MSNSTNSFFTPLNCCLLKSAQIAQFKVRPKQFFESEFKLKIDVWLENVRDKLCIQKSRDEAGIKK